MSTHLSVNGEAVAAQVRPDTPLAIFLREQLGLRGTKIGCAAGECGACTVLMDDRPVCACLTPVGRCEGSRVLTIEGVSDDRGGLHPVQRALVEHGAFQCGFCTPGVVMSTLALAAQPRPLADADIARALQGNVCRCSGYVKLLEAVKAVLAEQRA